MGYNSKEILEGVKREQFSNKFPVLTFEKVNGCMIFGLRKDLYFLLPQSIHFMFLSSTKSIVIPCFLLILDARIPKMKVL